jgi:hypothetical protein
VGKAAAAAESINAAAGGRRGRDAGGTGREERRGLPACLSFLARRPSLGFVASPRGDSTSLCPTSCYGKKKTPFCSLGITNA